MQPDEAERLTQELIRAVRGRRTQSALSRTLSYRSNIVHRWETGECFPTASQFLTASARLRPARKQLFVRFFKQQPSWLDVRAPFAPAQIAAFLRELRGKTPINTIAERSGFTRYQVTRWLSGKTQPKLPELLCVVEAASRRVLDLIAELCDPRELPSVANAWQQRMRARDIAYTSPWSHAVLHALELQGCREARGKRQLSLLADSLGVSKEVVKEGLEALLAIGQIGKVDGRYEPGELLSIDTSHDPARARGLKAAWTEVALQRMKRGVSGSFGYSVFAVSRKDLARLRELHLEYVRAMQSIISASQPNDCVALYCAQLFDLAESQPTAMVAAATTL